MIEDTIFGKEEFTSKEKVEIVVNEADGLKGENIKVIDIKDISGVADYFVIVTGLSRRHVRNIAQRIEKAIRKNRCKVNHVEGYNEAHWVLIDLNNVIVHIFDESTREYYELERLWGSGETLRASQSPQ